MTTTTADMPTEDITPTADEASAVAAYNARKSSRDRVLEAIMELCDAEIPARTPDLVRVTGLSITTVNDSIKVLKQRGMIYSDNGTFFVCNEHQPAEPVYHTAMPNGIIKLEKGDQILTLNPREARSVAKTMGGLIEQAFSIVLHHRQDEQQSQIRRLQRRIGQMEQAQQDAEELVKRVCEDLQALRSQLGG